MRDDPGTLWAPRRASWWVAVLFMAGAACFLVAPLPAFLQAVGVRVDALVFFVGSLLFTAAATLQWLAARRRSPDWWSSTAQLAGTLFFNVSTFRALDTTVDDAAYDQVVWRPDAFGSICFLVSGYLAYVEVTGGPFRRPPVTLAAAVASVNLFGCVAFAVSAVAAYVVPAAGSPLDVALANTATAVGALAFLVGAALLLPQGARSTQPATDTR